MEQAKIEVIVVFQIYLLNPANIYLSKNYNDYTAHNAVAKARYNNQRPNPII